MTDVVVKRAKPIELIAAASATGAWQEVRGGSYYFNVWGTFAAGETAALQWSPDQGTTVFAEFDGDAVAATAKSKTMVTLDDGWCRVALAVGTGSSLTATLGEVA